MEVDFVSPSESIDSFGHIEMNQWIRLVIQSPPPPTDQDPSSFTHRPCEGISNQSSSPTFMMDWAFREADNINLRSSSRGLCGCAMVHSDTADVTRRHKPSDRKTKKERKEGRKDGRVERRNKEKALHISLLVCFWVGL